MDAWDAVENNEFFSPEAWIFAFGQMFQARTSLCAVHCQPYPDIVVLWSALGRLNSHESQALAVEPVLRN